MAGFTGWLQADAFAGYNRLYEPNRQPGPIHAALCWAHARRGFFKLADIAANTRRGKDAPPISPLALETVRRIDAIFDLERALNGKPAADRLAARQEHGIAPVAALEGWLRTERARLSRHAPVAKAMDDMLTRWDGFTRFLGDGRLCLTNNAAERGLRGIALGRKAWLFCGSDRGGQRAAIMYGLITRTGSRELFTLSVLATALGIAFGSAALFGVSFALGAFFAGVVLSESDFSHQAAADALPLQDAFAVLFFVSVGMLFDPMILLRDPFAVLAVVLVIVLGKTLAAFGIVMAFGYPASTALTVSASLAQIGEFSFILAGLGVTLGLLPPEGRDLILAGALLSITLNPLVFVGLDRLSGWLRRRPGMLGRLERQRHDSLSVLPPAHEGPQDHAVIVGYGRVGSVVGKGLKSQNLPIVVIDQNRRRVEALRKRGVLAVYGDATTPGVLVAAGTRRARLIVVATPEGYQTRRVLDLARQINPSIVMAVRTHSEA